ncbi:sensor histidine kinase [Vallitalea longa]|uniref:histidine kinase n=1 Tax=Vallitalea longa TaxID=2936439 RepID=A0A9W5YBM0_9FIRM|nr:sensor histidine kinase [Vallitalea longa]GKX28288.1 sensor histidine kinase [Vallitalea longa]
MKIPTFIKNKIWSIITHLFLITFISVMLSIFDVNKSIIIFICILIIITEIVILLIEYIPKRIYYNKLNKILNNLDKKFFIHELIDEPSFQEGIILHDVIYQAAKSMNDEIAKYKISQNEYKEYIETWIHEIKTPIFCIDLICENNKNKMTESISEEINKINYFVEQALYYARSTTLEKDYVISNTNLKETIKKLVKAHAKELIKYKAEIKFDNLDKNVYCDSKWTSFILGQIITNSIKYRKETLTITFSSIENPNNIILIIRDNGIGIPKKDIGRVFNKGFTGENGRIYAKSTGIGLYLCKNLCNKMGLSLEIESQVDKGTIVRIIFPKDKTILFES